MLAAASSPGVGCLELSVSTCPSLNRGLPSPLQNLQPAAPGLPAAHLAHLALRAAPALPLPRQQGDRWGPILRHPPQCAARPSELCAPCGAGCGGHVLVRGGQRARQKLTREGSRKPNEPAGMHGAAPCTKLPPGHCAMDTYCSPCCHETHDARHGGFHMSSAPLAAKPDFRHSFQLGTTVPSCSCTCQRARVISFSLQHLSCRIFPVQWASFCAPQLPIRHPLYQAKLYSPVLSLAQSKREPSDFLTAPFSFQCILLNHVGSNLAVSRCIASVASHLGSLCGLRINLPPAVACSSIFRPTFGLCGTIASDCPLPRMQCI